MKAIVTAFLMFCVFSTTALNLAFTLRPDETTDFVREVTGL